MEVTVVLSDPNHDGFTIILVNGEFIGALFGKAKVEIYEGDSRRQRWLVRVEGNAIIADYIKKE